MNFLSYKYFIKVVSERSFTRAAEKLYVSQQCLSQHIKRLEEHYQIALFERKPGLKLTFAGEKMLKFAKQLKDSEDALLTELSYINKNETGSVIFGINASRSPVIVPNVFKKFKSIHPNIMLSLRESSTTQLEELLLDGEIDLVLGVRGNDSLDDINFNMIKLMKDDDLFLIVSDTLLEMHYPEIFNEREKYAGGICIMDVAELPVVLNLMTSRVHKEVDSYYRSKGTKPNMLIESNNNVLSLFPLCEQGIVAIYTTQIQLLYMLSQIPDLKNRVNIFPVSDLCLYNTIVLMHHKGRKISRFMSDLIDITKEVFTELKVLINKLNIT